MADDLTAAAAAWAGSCNRTPRASCPHSMPGLQEGGNKKLTGRRKKLQRKVKPGSFGERLVLAGLGWLLSCDRNVSLC